MANTSPISIIAPPVRHRKAAPVWAPHEALEEARTWLRHSVRASRATHLAVGAGYTSVAVLAGVVAAVIAR